MAAAGEHAGSPVRQLKAVIQRLPGWIGRVDDTALGEELIEIRESIDQLEAAFAGGLHRFDRSGEFKADGALSLVDWLRWKCKLSGGAAMERVSIARQLENLPLTQQAFASADVGYQHVALLARTAEKVGAPAVQRGEANLLKAAETMDPGRFVGIAKEFEYRVDHAAALAEANRAYARRYLHLSEPKDGLVHLEGLLDAEGGATLNTALDALMPPPKKGDDRTPGSGGSMPWSTLPGATPAQLQGAGPVPAETAQRYACDASVSYLLGQAELAGETSHEHRRISASTRRALVARDRDCVFPGCHRPPIWCDGHHLIWWTRGGKTVLPNLALVCGRHHRMLHEEGWTLERTSNGRWVAAPPARPVAAHARSA